MQNLAAKEKASKNARWIADRVRPIFLRVTSGLYRVNVLQIGTKLSQKRRLLNTV